MSPPDALTLSVPEDYPGGTVTLIAPAGWSLKEPAAGAQLAADADHYTAHTPAGRRERGLGEEAWMIAGLNSPVGTGTMPGTWRDGFRQKGERSMGIAPVPRKRMSLAAWAAMGLVPWLMAAADAWGGVGPTNCFIMYRLRDNLTIKADVSDSQLRFDKECSFRVYLYNTMSHPFWNAKLDVLSDQFEATVGSVAPVEDLSRRAIGRHGRHAGVLHRHAEAEAGRAGRAVRRFAAGLHVAVQGVEAQRRSHLRRGDGPARDSARGRRWPWTDEPAKGLERLARAHGLLLLRQGRQAGVLLLPADRSDSGQRRRRSRQHLPALDVHGDVTTAAPRATRSSSTPPRRSRPNPGSSRSTNRPGRSPPTSPRRACNA